MKKAVALGSGGARGFAHIALLEKLDSLGFVPDIVTGSSIGAVVGAFFCLYGIEDTLTKMLGMIRSNSAVMEKAREIKKGKRSLREDVINMSRIIFAHSLMKDDILYETLKGPFKSKRFSDCKTEFAVVAFNLDRGDPVVIDEGFILDAIVASSSVPGTFPPVRLGGMHLVDGGTTRLIPVREAKKAGAGFVVSSDVAPSGVDLSNLMMFQYSVDNIKGKLLADLDLSESDFPVKFDIPNVEWYEFDKAGQIYAKASKELENIDFSNLEL